MKTYYLYVPDGDCISSDSVLIWLSVGSSDREFVKLKLLENYALDLGQFLRIKDDVTDGWLDHHAKRIFKGSQLPRLHFKSCCLTITECYRMVIDGSLEMFVRHSDTPSHFMQMLITLDSNYSFHHLKNPRMTSCPRGKRKYLSHSERKGLLFATMPVWLILGFGLIDLCGEHVINVILKLL